MGNCGCSGKCGDNGQQKTLKEKIEEIINAVRPNLQAHGGDIELVSVEKDNSVKVRLQGACCGCPGAQMTLKNGIERILKERLPEVKEVIPVD